MGMFVRPLLIMLLAFAWVCLPLAKHVWAVDLSTSNTQWVTLVSPWQALHSQPRTNSKQIGVVYGNDVFRVLHNLQGWLRVQRADGMQGWLPLRALQTHYPRLSPKGVEADNSLATQAFRSRQVPNTGPQEGVRVYRSYEGVPWQVRWRLVQAALMRWSSDASASFRREMAIIAGVAVSKLDSRDNTITPYDVNRILRSRQPIGMTRRGLKNRGISQKAINTKAFALTSYQKIWREAKRRERIKDTRSAIQAYADLILLQSADSTLRYQAIYALNRLLKVRPKWLTPPSKKEQIAPVDFSRALALESQLLQTAGDILLRGNNLSAAKNLYEGAVVIGKVFSSQLKVLTNLTNQKRKGITPSFVAQLNRSALNNAINATERLAVVRNFAQSRYAVTAPKVLAALFLQGLRKSRSLLERAEHIKRVREATLQATAPLALLQVHQYADNISKHDPNNYWRVEIENIITMRLLKSKIASLSPQAQVIVKALCQIKRNPATIQVDGFDLPMPC